MFRLCLVFMMFIAFSSDARFSKSTLTSFVNNSNTVVTGKIIASEIIEWESAKGIKVCGFKNKIRVNESLVGNQSETVIFASRSPLKVNDNYLLFLNDGARLLTDFLIEREPSEQHKLDNCISSLPLLKENWLGTSQFYGPYQDNILLSYWVKPPQTIKSLTMEVTVVMQDDKLTPINSSNAKYLEKDMLPRQLVEWKVLRTYLYELINKKMK